MTSKLKILAFRQFNFVLFFKTIVPKIKRGPARLPALACSVSFQSLSLILPSGKATQKKTAANDR
jgi:hypothetical protein